MGMDFSDALRALKGGHRVARAGWSGKGLWVSLIEEWSAVVGHPDDKAAYETRPWVGVKTVDEQFMPWAVSQSDMLADDWEIVD